MNKKRLNNRKKLASLSSNSYPPTLRKKKEYRAFIRLIREDRLSFFSEVAKEIGVNRETIARWYETKPVQKALVQSADEFVAKISQSKSTWKDYANMLDMFQR